LAGTQSDQRLTQNATFNYTHLKEHGLLMISDWALLNDTKPKQVERMLVKTFNWREALAAEMALIYEAYRSVYLIGAISGGRCADPTETQWQQMGEYLYSKTQSVTHSVTRNDDILKKLRDIAKMIRQ
jgi:hypothetical protein